MTELPFVYGWIAGGNFIGAVYAAVAQRYGTTLVTLDRQQLERLPPTVPTTRPTDALREAQARYGIYG